VDHSDQREAEGAVRRLLREMYDATRPTKADGKEAFE
jgi:hypothetical protein